MEWQFTLDQLTETARSFWKAAGPARVFAFHGAMGVGKTTFIHALCEAKGVPDVVGSPSYAIINEYRYEEEGARKPLYHMDLYRLNDEEEAQRAGVEEALYSGQICLVEWPERAPGIFPEDTVHVFIELVDSTTRRLKIADK
ncbi:MAG: tRNA (adenosine(37)-N6)-threonylcarbamoyltransferase complex ATPase subunit type 1 TsaE [Sphingobacteriales bacterium]|nr:tRNA (adenosine(37)-N6)-threonylcarbamoyltransferase complex ATPase subunit type 1 TsaE [Sphingobacteriales bacterium]